MNVILLSGGTGKRLWPLSKNSRPKQFIPLFPSENGENQSMLQRMYRNIKKTDNNANITIAASYTQIPLIRSQIKDEVNISAEPSCRDTFPAIVLATAYLHDVLGISEEESVVVCPVDPYVEDDYFTALQLLKEQADTNQANLVLMGITPVYPAEKYGYIIPETQEKFSFVKAFKEKPDTETARQYLLQNALWNSGVFAYKLKYLLNIAHQQISFTDYEDLFAKYDTLPKISFDYAVVEKERHIQVMRFSGKWSDIGTWNTFTEIIPQPIVGNALMNEKCHNVHIINELSIPIIAMGLQNVVICANRTGILISDKEQADKIKSYVEKTILNKKAENTVEILDIQQTTVTKKITVFPEQSEEFQSNCDEVWVCLSGDGILNLYSSQKQLIAGDTVRIPSDCRYTVTAHSPLQLLKTEFLY